MASNSSARRFRRPIPRGQEISKPSIRRLARRGGVKRLSADVYDESRTVLRAYLEKNIQDAVTYMEYSKRKTVSALDVVYALKKNGTVLYGYGGASNVGGGRRKSVPTKKRKKASSSSSQKTARFEISGDMEEDSVANSNRGNAEALRRKKLKTTVAQRTKARVKSTSRPVPPELTLQEERAIQDRKEQVVQMQEYMDSPNASKRLPKGVLSTAITALTRGLPFMSYDSTQFNKWINRYIGKGTLTPAAKLRIDEKVATELFSSEPDEKGENTNIILALHNSIDEPSVMYFDVEKEEVSIYNPFHVPKDHSEYYGGITSHLRQYVSTLNAMGKGPTIPKLRVKSRSNDKKPKLHDAEVSIYADVRNYLYGIKRNPDMKIAMKEDKAEIMKVLQLKKTVWK